MSKAKKSRGYKPRTLSGAQSRVRQLEKLAWKFDAMIGELRRERRALAKLAADGPAFDNPLHEITALKIRDRILRIECGLNPDGSVIPQTSYLRKDDQP